MKRKATFLLIALLLAACGNGDGDLAPVGFPECTPMPERSVDPVPGLVVPPDAHLLRARPSGQRLTAVKGWVAMDPVAIRKFYGSVRRKPGYDFFFLEDEVIEAEAFFTDGKWRNYVRARTLCEGRSLLHILVAPEDYGSKLNIQPRTSSPSPNV